MDTSGLPLSPAELEQFQRECHPFPAYVDYTHGRSPKYEAHKTLHAAPVRSPLSERADSIGLSPHAYLEDQALRAPPPRAESVVPIPPSTSFYMQKTSQPGSSRQLSRDFYSLPGRQASGTLDSPPITVAMPTMPPSSPPDLPANMFSKAAVAQPPPQIPILRINELLQPHYAWLPSHTRHSLNAKVITLYSVLRNPQETLPIRHQARATLLHISQDVSTEYTKHLQAETAERNAKRSIHIEMPKIWNALKMRQQLPPQHPLQVKAAQYLKAVAKAMNPAANEYARGVLQDMARKEGEGREAVEAVPGYRAQEQNRGGGGGGLEKSMGHVAAKEKEQEREDVRPRMMGGHASASPAWASSPPQSESSPLPEWRAF